MIEDWRNVWNSTLAKYDSLHPEFELSSLVPTAKADRCDKMQLTYKFFEGAMLEALLADSVDASFIFLCMHNTSDGQNLKSDAGGRPETRHTTNSKLLSAP